MPQTKVLEMKLAVRPCDIEFITQDFMESHLAEEGLCCLGVEDREPDEDERRVIEDQVPDNVLKNAEED